MIGRTSKERLIDKYVWILFDDRTFEQVPFPRQFQSWSTSIVDDRIETASSDDVVKTLREAVSFLKTMKIAGADLIRLFIKAAREHPEQVQEIMTELIGEAQC